MSQPISKEQEEEINKIYESWLHAYLNADIKTYDQYFDDNYHFIGSTDNEEFLNRKDTTHFFQQTADQLAGKTDLRNNHRILEKFGNIIFLTHLFDAWFKNEEEWVFYGRFRFTNALHETNNGWRFIYQHFSTPDSQTVEGETIGFDRVNEENKELRLAIQRRTKELEEKNQELLIESSLERVRAVAMGMSKPEDLLEICEIVYTEFERLGFLGLRNAMINIYKEDTSLTLNYDYSETFGKTVTHFQNSIHPIVEKLVNETKNKNNAFSQFSFKGKELDSWRKFRQENGEADDPRLDKAEGLYYYFYSVGTAAIGISTFEPISETQLNLLKRFRNVFNLAYQRYIDIYRAEQQLRKAKVDAALERVRSEALAMQQSSDLLDIVVSMRKEFINLGHEAHYFWHMLWLPEIYEKAMTSGDGTKIGFVMNLPRHMHGNIPLLNKWEQSSEETIVYAMDVEEAIDYVDKMVELGDFKHIDPQAPTHDDIRHINGLTFVMARTTHGEIGYSLPGKVENPPKEDIDLLIKFSKAFDFAHKRFLDLQQSEARVRETQIELALEKVRSRTMAMQHSDELPEAANLLFQEVQRLGIPAWSCGYNILSEDFSYSTCIMSSEGELQQPFKLPLNEHYSLKFWYDALNSGEQMFVNHQEGEDLVEHYEYMKNLPELKATFQQFEDAGLDLPTTQYNHLVRFPQGFLLFITYEPVPEAHDIFKRFGTVFEQTYTRFLDLQKAEKQAREGQIEVALERIRSRSMGMHKSEELTEVIQIVYDQFQNLNINVDHAGFVVDYSPKQDWHFWIADQNEIPSKVTTPYFESVWANQFNEAKQTGQEIFTTHLDFDEKNKFYQDLLSYVPHLPQESINFYLNCPGLAITTVLMENVGLYIENFEGIPFTVEENDIIQRFGRVFQQTYTRFLDLQKAEAQARESQIEASLERVRSRAMAMQSSLELMEAGELLYKELSKLGIHSLTSGYVLMNEDASIGWNYAVNPGDGSINPNPTAMDYTGSKVMKSIKNSWEKQEPMLMLHLNPEETIAHQTYIAETTTNFPLTAEELLNISPERLVINTYNFEHGFLLIVGGKILSDEENDMVSRFAKVFAITYRRFLDLKITEEQAREAQINLAVERVRASALAMYTSAEILDVVYKLKEEMMALNIPNVIAATIHLEQKNGKKRMWDLSSIIIEDGTINIPMDITYELDNIDPKHFLRRIWENQDQFYLVRQDLKDLKITLDWARSHGFDQQMDETETFIEESGLQYLYHPTIQLNNGRMSIDLLDEPTEEIQSILTKIGAAFNLAYKRFEDLKKSEEQAREAQIEAALERVRSRSMAMQNSNEIGEVAFVLYQQLKALGGELWGTGIAFCEADSNVDEAWFVTDNGLMPNLKIPNDEDEAHIKMYQGWENNQDLFSMAKGGKDLAEHYQYMLNLPDIKPIFQGILDKGISFPEWQKWHAAYFKYGYLLIITTEPYPDEQIFVRFAKVFEQAYTRFLDLQKAEAQAKEAKIEASLERVRSRSMGMQHSNELGELSLELVKQVQNLGVSTWFCAFNIEDGDPQGSIEWGSNGEAIFPKYRTPREGIFLEYANAKKEGYDLYVREIKEPECAAHYDYLCTLPGVGDQLLQMKAQGIPFPTSQIDHVAFFKFGYIIFITYDPVPESHEIFKRFAKVFEQTYTRFLDLQKAEAQAREAKIEAALENVRSRSMAMQHSEEIKNVVATIVEKVGELNIAMDGGASLATMLEGSKDLIHWYVNPEHLDEPRRLHLKYFPCKVYDDFNEARERKQELLSVVYNKAEKDEYFKTAFEISEFGSAPDELKQWIFDQDYFGYTVAIQEHAVIFFNDYSGKKFSDEENDILLRFSKVFEQAYVRFLDLQKAEAQAIRAEQDLIEIKKARKKAEDALNELQSTQRQLIQSEKMASLGELTAGIAHEIQNPLNFVNNFSEVSSELLDEIEEEMANGDLEEVKAILDDIKANLEKINHHGKRADSIVKGMLEHSRISSGEKQLTDINALCEEYLRLAYHGLRAKDKSFNSEIITDFDDTFGKVSINPQEIGRVILNIINNAFYAVNKRKKDVIREDFKPTVKLSTKKVDKSIRICITDNGGGIPQNIIEKIFQPFFTTKPTGQGTGLGLSMSYDIIKAHRGELKVESRESENTKFTILLPSN